MKKLSDLFGNRNTSKYRWKMINELYNQYSLPFLKAALNKPAMNVLHLGCHHGELTAWLAQQDNVNHVTATDIDENILRKAVKKNHSPKITYQQLSAYDLSQLKATFDLVYERFVLTQLTSPQAALKAVYNQLNPNGKFICDSIIYSHAFSTPKEHSYDEFIKLILQLSTSQGKDPDLGKSLASIALSIGFSIEDCQIHQPFIRRKIEKQWVLSGLKNACPAFIRENLADEKQLQALVKDMQKVLQDSNKLWAAPSICQLKLKK